MKIKIGKAEDNDFIVNDPHVSRHHACLVREDHGCWLLEDLGSTNGTFVNGSQIVKSVLHRQIRSCLEPDIY